MSILSSAKAVLLNESKAIEKMALSLDSDFGKVFETVIKLILESKGRVVLTGMGKSGHIAKKIAATLASTGTPSFFIHPAEASHGDLGMITHEDIVIALSKSGKTGELEAILNYCARYGLKVIAITESNTSMLSKLSTHTLLLPDVAEACPLGAAPTTSTTLMLALGDAIALTLLEERGFTAEKFNVYHPGGHLGKKLMLVRDIMHTQEFVPLAPKSMKMSEAILLMTRYSFGCLGIIENKELVGIITDGDLRRNLDTPNFLEKEVKDVMGNKPITITPDTAVAAALQLMNAKSITALFVVENDIPVGIVHIHDCLKSGIQ